jgi:hypothetical protein
VTAGEIRKRIAQYYQDPGHEQEIRLLLPSGSYVPRFCLPGEIVAEGAEMAEPTEAHNISLPESSVLRRSPKLYVGLVVVLTLTGVLAWRLSRPAPIDVFWAPFFKSSDPILFCVADQNQYSTIVVRDAADAKHQTTLNDRMVAVIIDDLSPLVNIAGMLQSHGRTSSTWRVSYLLQRSATSAISLHRSFRQRLDPAIHSPSQISLRE